MINREKILIKLKLLERNFPELTFDYKVNFNLISNKNMGEYSIDKNIIYFNMPIAERAKEDYYEIIIHEFAHMVATKKYGKNILIHGKEWKNIMKQLNSKNISAKIDFNKYIKNRIKVYCDCQEFYITKNRYTRMKNGRKYTCKKCNTMIRE